VTYIGVSHPNRFYRNDGNDTFTSLTTLPANDPADSGGSSQGCNWGDYDNDGWLDLFVANMGGQNDFLYHNNGDGTFTKVVGDIAVSDATSSWAPAWAIMTGMAFWTSSSRTVSATIFSITTTGTPIIGLSFG
jgi:hypothetical protein